jgi:adenine-specific DNA methylase
MKKILLSIVLASSMMFAQSTQDDTSRLENMQTLAQAMHKVQDGFLYNNKELIKEGALTILNTSSSIESKDLKKTLPPETAYAHKFAQKMASRTKAHAQGIIDAIDNNDALAAMDEYLYVLRQCTSCHLRIRSW